MPSIAEVSALVAGCLVVEEECFFDALVGCLGHERES